MKRKFKIKFALILRKVLTICARYINFVRLMLTTTNENSVICDPFSSSATMGIAANLLGRKFIGIEKESEFIEISKKRKAELKAKFDVYKSKN